MMMAAAAANQCRTHPALAAGLRGRHTRRRQHTERNVACVAQTTQTAETSSSSSSSSSTVALPFRVGHGFDLHRLETGVGKLMLAGVEIPHTKGCAAHSDGDVLLHTVTGLIILLPAPNLSLYYPVDYPIG